MFVVEGHLKRSVKVICLSYFVGIVVIADNNLFKRSLRAYYHFIVRIIPKSAYHGQIARSRIH